MTTLREYNMKKHLIIILVAMVGLLLGTNGFAQEQKGAGDRAGNMAEGQRMNAFMVEKIIGSKVINVKGETLGTIEDLVVDIDTGSILYAILASGGFWGIGDKLAPIPWASLASLPAEGTFFLNQSKAQMENAPAFDKNNLPDMTDRQWGESVFTHYGVTGDEQQGPMGYGYGYGGYYGSPMHPGLEREGTDKKIFDAATIQTISGQVIKVDYVSEPGFGMDMRLTVFIDKHEVLPVYLGPAFYIVGSDGQANTFRIGDQVIVSGSQVTDQGEPFMLAMTVTRGNEILQLRDKDGNPAWIGWKKTE